MTEWPCEDGRRAQFHVLEGIVFLYPTALAIPRDPPYAKASTDADSEHDFPEVIGWDRSRQRGKMSRNSFIVRRRPCHGRGTGMLCAAHVRAQFGCGQTEGRGEVLIFSCLSCFGAAFEEFEAPFETDEGGQAWR
ncbi:uncharacterized protein M421DRAFT_283131 [Didymella exigua CBS 183.55]|uniref:Uncharacterized protein n=1 Tax=Didymella exigua CBS 183.55 TaxID=1150837 RepID=A0A6A5RWU1_9PLEO|nr:uncharacterized protein M421DRAFT_283131 [Didymella exigua CBS 183.55]KAF1932043.1 hypothetical protein M421DRAFT_283131 [Didymella exigua CBS 183.55]